MLRYSQIVTVLGCKLADRLIRARWITPLPCSSSRAIYFDRCQVHRALRRLAREGNLVSVRSASLSDPPKVQNPSLEEVLANAELVFE